MPCFGCWVANHPTLSGLNPNSLLSTVALWVDWAQLGSSQTGSFMQLQPEWLELDIQDGAPHGWS